MNVRSQVNEPKTKIMLQFNTWSENDSLQSSHIWVEKEKAEEIILLLKKSISELS